MDPGPEKFPTVTMLGVTVDGLRPSSVNGPRHTGGEDLTALRPAVPLRTRASALSDHKTYEKSDRQLTPDT